jgi:hypothetical protein
MNSAYVTELRAAWEGMKGQLGVLKRMKARVEIQRLEDAVSVIENAAIIECTKQSLDAQPHPLKTTAEQLSEFNDQVERIYDIVTTDDPCLTGDALVKRTQSLCDNMLHSSAVVTITQDNPNHVRIELTGWK